jgi:hypothetical protein
MLKQPKRSGTWRGCRGWAGAARAAGRGGACAQGRGGRADSRVRDASPGPQVLCLREGPRSGAQLDPQRSFLLAVRLPTAEAAPGGAPAPEAVGWEANAEGKLLPRCGHGCEAALHRRLGSREQAHAPI